MVRTLEYGTYIDPKVGMSKLQKHLPGALLHPGPPNCPQSWTIYTLDSRLGLWVLWRSRRDRPQTRDIEYTSNIHIYIYIYLQIYTHTHIYIHVDICIYVCIYIYVCMNRCVYLCIYMYIHMYTYMLHIYIYTLCIQYTYKDANIIPI